jgi:predicted Zn-dependent protease
VDRGKDCIEIDRADIRILTIDRQTQEPLSDEEMKKTCLHELGHSMGLQGHSTNNHDIMFFSMSNTNWPVLSKRDKATVFMIYQNYQPLMSAQQ